MRIGDRSERTKRLSMCAMLSALGVVVLYLGSIIEVIDISMAVIASLFAIFAVIEYGAGYAWSIYAITGILSAVLLPNKFPALMYLLFFGFYPIIKEKIEKLRSKIAQWALKELLFNVCLILLMVLGNYILMIDMKAWFAIEVVFFALANGTFVIYDIALTRLISLYIFRLRIKLRIK